MQIHERQVKNTAFMSNPKTSWTSLPTQVLIGAILGILTGLFLGDQTAILNPIGTIYTMLLQVVVYPYLICTLLSSLGKLSPQLSWRLLKNSWAFYLFLLILTFGIMILLAKAIPLNITNTPSDQTAAIAGPGLLDLLIPQNLFTALSNNYIPAVIIFCILFGVTMQFADINKTNFFNILDVISKTCILFWSWLVKFAPFAIFALLANVAGTIKLNQLTDLSEFLILFSIGSLVLIFWLLPIIICSFVGERYKNLIYELRSALIVSLATTLSVVALPYIRDATIKMLAEHHKKLDLENSEIVNATLLISYPLAQLGNFFIYLFILFATLYFNHPITKLQNILLPFVSFLASIGSPSTSINSVAFLSSWLNLPVETTNLYVSIMPLIRYLQVIVSVMGFAFLTILITFSYFKILKINWKKLIFHIIIVFILLGVFVYLVRGFIPNPDIKIYTRLNSFTVSENLTRSVPAAILTLNESQLQPAKNPQDSLFRIQSTRILRVGFNADNRPFVFFNNKNQLAGYDIAFAYALANALNARIEFIPFTWQNLVNDLEADKFDIAVSAIYVTEERLKNIIFTDPYLRSPISLIVPKANQDQFTTAEQIRNIPNVKIGVFNDPVLIPIIQNNFPNAKIVILPEISGDETAQAFAQHQIDAALWSQTQTQIWVLTHPDYVSLAPTGLPAPFLIAYMVQQSSPQFLNFLNYWLQLKKNDGFQTTMYNHWILSRPLQDNLPRWSIMRNVLHWQK